MKTIYHAYHFDTSNLEQRQAYHDLCARLEARGSRCFKSWGGNSHHDDRLNGVELTLDATHLFSDQWSTMPVMGVEPAGPPLSVNGLRVFDWAEDSIWYGGRENTTLKQGHYLDLTQEMLDARVSRYACGYCGTQYDPKPTYDFCHACLDGPHLKSTDLYMLRLVPVTLDEYRRPLDDAERATLLAEYREAQLQGTSNRAIARIARIRDDINKKYTKAINGAGTEHEGMTWVLDHFGPTLCENCIYYPHSARFHFGWREPIDDELLSRVLDGISEFPFPYDITSKSRGKIGSA